MRHPWDRNHVTLGKPCDVLSDCEYPSRARIPGSKWQLRSCVRPTQPLRTLRPRTDRRDEYFNGDLTAARERHFHRHQHSLPRVRNDHSEPRHRSTPALWAQMRSYPVANRPPSDFQLCSRIALAGQDHVDRAEHEILGPTPHRAEMTHALDIANRQGRPRSGEPLLTSPRGHKLHKCANVRYDCRSSIETASCWMEADAFHEACHGCNYQDIAVHETLH